MRSKSGSIFGGDEGLHSDDPQESYREYRSRQRRENTAVDGESVWDDEVEEAFFEGKEFLLGFGSLKYAYMLLA